MERGGADLSTRRRARQIATAFHKPFRCLLMVQSSLQVCFVSIFLITEPILNFYG